MGFESITEVGKSRNALIAINMNVRSLQVPNVAERTRGSVRGPLLAVTSLSSTNF
jgi:hypothetical protein